jgi:iron complex transport system ATP-binding protein
MDSDPPFRLAGLAALGPYFALQTTGAAASGDWQPVTALVTDAGRLAELIDRVAVRLGGARWIAASVFYQGWAARLTSIYAGSIVLGSPVPDLGLNRLQVRVPVSGPAELLATPLIAVSVEAGWRRLTDDHLTMLAAAIRGQVRIGAQLLRGNLAAALAGSLGALAGQAPLADLLRHEWAQPAGLARYGRWFDTAQGPRYVRTTCCGFDRVPGGGRCGDCSLARPRG